MDALLFSPGEAGWLEKSRFFRELIASRPGPPYRWDDILLLVPSSRTRRTYERLFLELAEETHAASALVPPEIETLSRFAQKLWLRLGNRRLIDENSRLVLCEGIVKHIVAEKKLFAGRPELLAPPLSAAIAEMIEDLSFAGVGPGRLEQAADGEGILAKDHVRLLADAYRRYEELLAEKNLVDPPGLLVRLAEDFDPARLGYSRIVIDGLHDANELEARLLAKLIAAGPSSLLIDAPSPETIRNAGPGHPLLLTKEFLARLGLFAGKAAAPSPDDDLFLSRALFSSKTFKEAASEAPAPSSFGRSIRSCSAATMREEATFIAREVKKALMNGTAADSVLVAFPSLDEYGPLIEEIFGDCGIPFNRALGRPLSASPVATALVSLLRAAQDDCAGLSLMRVLSSPFLKFAEQEGLPAALDRLMRERRVVGGKEKLLSALRRYAPSGEDDPSSPVNAKMLEEPLADLFAALAPFSRNDAAPLAVWMERLNALVRWSGMGPRVSLIKGPLNTNLQAHRKLSETIASLAAAGRLFPEYRSTFDEWFLLFRKALQRARFQVPPEDEGGVQILGLEESVGRSWSEVYLGGLVDGKFPRRLPQNIFLPGPLLEALGVKSIGKARLNAAYHFYRLLLSAPKVTLTRPETESDKPLSPSPFLKELEPLRIAKLLKEDVFRSTLSAEQARSVPELAKAAAFALYTGGSAPEGTAEVLEANLPGMSGIRSAMESAPGSPVPAIARTAKREFRVTELDAYLACPYDYYVRYVLGIEPLEEATEDISALDRGSAVHAILRNFYLAWKEPVTQENRSGARALLGTLADKAFDAEADTFRNRREKELFLSVMAERFLDAETEFWKSGMKPAYLEQKIELFTVALSDGTEAVVKGKIDRIDADRDGNFIVVDYKTGRYPLPKMGTGQEIFQLPLYAVMANTLQAGKAPTLKKPVGLAYYDLAGKTGAGARDVVLFDKEARDDHPASKPRASAKTSAEFEAILEESVDKARKAIEGILSNDFAAAPRDESRCRYCPSELMCSAKSD